jgi:hypothetical protein
VEEEEQRRQNGGDGGEREWGIIKYFHTKT